MEVVPRGVVVGCVAGAFGAGDVSFFFSRLDREIELRLREDVLLLSASSCAMLVPETDDWSV